MITIELGPAGLYRHPLGPRICKKDRQWFQANPLRQHYVRRMIPGLFMGEDAAKIMCDLLSEAPGRFVPAEELVTRMFSELTSNGRA
jgi:hypothetical protein